MSNYLKTVEEVYAEAAQNIDGDLCCTTGSKAWPWPDLRIPEIMLRMDYGCGSTVDPRDLRPADTIAYVGVGGGLEALQFAYFTRRPGSVMAVDPVADMRRRAQENLEEAARLNPWFRPDFITLLDGNALDLPLENGSATVAAQNCLFNVFTRDDLDRALAEIVRVLQVGGLFSTSDPITPVPLPQELRDDARLRARCISGCQTFEDYIAAVTGGGFGHVEIRARVPYRLLLPAEYPALKAPLMLESVEVAARKVPDGPDGPEVFTGRTATYAGPDETWTDTRGHALRRGVPTPVSDAAARRLAKNPDILLTGPSYRSRRGCC